MGQAVIKGNTIAALHLFDMNSDHSRNVFAAELLAHAHIAGSPATAASTQRPRAKTLEAYLGTTLKARRLKLNLTIADVAAKIGISRGMLSKIENGQASTSLDTLAKLAGALGMGMGSLFRDYDQPELGATLVRRGDAMQVVRRGSRSGFRYELLSCDPNPEHRFEAFLVTIESASHELAVFEHTGVEFIYVLEGKFEFRHGIHTDVLESGDSLALSARVPHGPVRFLSLPIRCIVVVVSEHCATGLAA